MSAYVHWRGDTSASAPDRDNGTHDRGGFGGGGDVW